MARQAHNDNEQAHHNKKVKNKSSSVKPKTDEKQQNSKTSNKKSNSKSKSNDKIKKGELISKKKVVYIDIDDEVTDVYNKIAPLSAKHVYIVAPKRAIIFQSVVNLKILKRKADDKNKKIYFITNDKNGIYLAQQLKIPVYDKVNKEGKPSLFSSEVENTDKLRITPIRASVNSVEDDTPVRLKEKKISISQILSLNKKSKTVDVKKIDSPIKKIEEKKSRFVLMSPNRHALIGLISATVLILLLIVYIALPGVTIYITPTASVLDKYINITLADHAKNSAELEIAPSHMIASYPIEIEVSKSITHFSTGKEFSERGVNASGHITIINKENRVWKLVPQTRFQTPDGIVFRITETAEVPAASGDTPGKLEVFVSADPVDAYGAVVGERGNIGPSKFVLPGLSKDSQSKLYAESDTEMTGGVTDFISFISKEDIDAAEIRLKEELTQEAIEKLSAAVEEKSDLAGHDVTYSLLNGENAVKLSEINIELDENLENRQTDRFDINGTITAKGVYYDHDAMLQILKDELMLKKSPQKELLRINEESTSYRIFEWDDNTGKIKLTANIKGIEQYEIDPEKENGKALLDKMKQHIVGMEIEEAKQFIQNRKEINKVEIESWPAWSPTIPNLPDNIEFEIMTAHVVE